MSKLGRIIKRAQRILHWLMLTACCALMVLIPIAWFQSVAWAQETDRQWFSKKLISKSFDERSGIDLSGVDHSLWLLVVCEVDWLPEKTPTWHVDGFIFGLARLDSRTIVNLFMPFWAPLVAVSIYPLVTLMRGPLRRRSRRRRNLCIHCAYNLTGVTNTCPECGNAFPPPSPRPWPARIR